MERQGVYRPESGRERSYSKEGVLRETFGTGQCWWASYGKPLAPANVGGKNASIWTG